jgi:hypothetical protein
VDLLNEVDLDSAILHRFAERFPRVADHAVTLAGDDVRVMRFIAKFMSPRSQRVLRLVAGAMHDEGLRVLVTQLNAEQKAVLGLKL